MVDDPRRAATDPMGTTHPHRILGYMPALDGLRALAVAAVVLYHLNVPQLPGGYLGVDVFFVVSGFLITALLLAELDRWGSVDLAAFWIRRARRLLPALFVVMGAVVAYAQFLAQPAQRAQLRGDGLATLLYYSNWRFIYAGESYFAQYGDPSPLRHTWSLAIEEQWYFVLPLLMTGLAALGLFRRRALAVSFGAGAVLSAAWAAHLYNPDVDPSRVYYGTDTRVQGLLTGACLAAVLGHRAWGARAAVPTTPSQYLKVGPWTVRLGGPLLIQHLAMLGAVILAAAMALLPESSSWLYQGGFLVVAIASAAIIMAIRGPGPLTTLLSLPPLRWLGRISYGVYLWHWPIIVILSPERTGLQGITLGLFRIAMTLGISELSYRFVELPVRRGRLRALSARRVLRPRIVAVVVPVALIVALVVATPPDPSASKTVNGLSVTKQVAPKENTRVLLVGDSTAFTLATSWSAALTPGVTVTSSTRLGCGFARGGRLIGNQRYPEEEKCSQWPTDWANAVKESSPDIVLLMAGAWETVDHVVDGQVLTVGSDAYGAYIAKELDEANAVLSSRGARLGLVDAPCYQEPDGGMYGSDLRRQRNDPTRLAWLNAQYQKYADARPDNVSVIHLESLLCDQQGKPLSAVEGRLATSIREDGVHYTDEGAKVVWKWLATQLSASQDAAPSQTAYFLGDSVPYRLREASDGRHGGVTLDGATLLGCGLVTSPRVVAGRVEATPPECSDWSKVWPKQARQATYDVGVLWPGIGELFDHRVDGKTLTFASARYRQYLRAEYKRAFDTLSADDRPVVMVTMPCHDVPDGDGREAPVINDPKRVAWVNEVAKEVAKENGFGVVDLDAHLCEHGYNNRSGTVTLREDGLHFTPEGASVILDWLLPEIFRQAGLRTP